MEFTFWKENKVDQEYKLTLEEIKDKYRAFCKAKGFDWLVYYGHATVNFFIGDNELGLNSVAESDTYIQLQNELLEVRHEFYPKDQ